MLLIGRLRSLIEVLFNVENKSARRKRFGHFSEKLEKMAEHDDALLDEDFASLPDVNDEDYELDFDNDDATISSQEESISEQVSYDCQSSLEDILDLTDFDACEEYEEELELETNGTHIENTKQKIIFSNNNDLEVQFDDQNRLSYNETGLSENNHGSESRSKTSMQPIVHEQANLCVGGLKYPQPTEIECGSCNFNRVSNRNRSYIQPIEELPSPSIRQPCYDFQDQRTNFNNKLPVQEPYSIDHLNNQYVVWCNPNLYPNYECHPALPQYQNPPCANQFLPMHPTIQVLHSHVPLVKNTAHQPILTDLNRQILYNQNISPYYFDSTRYDQSPCESQDHPQYVLNPLYKQDHSNKQKIFLNRRFSQLEARREDLLKDEFYKTDLFLKKIAFKNVNNQHNNNSYQFKNNMDPYSYFSDIWQTKHAHIPSRYNLNTSRSPEILSTTSVLQRQKREFKKNRNNQREQKRLKTCNTKNSFSIKRKVYNTRKNMNTKKNCTRKQKNELPKAKGTDAERNEKPKVAEFKIKIEEKMDPEMIEYYKKIEEQKRRRDEFLLEKETRRKLLAMEKIGIKKEPFLD